MKGKIFASSNIYFRWLSASAVPEQQEEEEGVQKEVKEVKKVPESNAWQELLDRKLHKLDMDVRRTGRAGLYDLENTLSNVEKGMKCTANQVKLMKTNHQCFQPPIYSGTFDTKMLWICVG